MKTNRNLPLDMAYRDWHNHISTCTHCAPVILLRPNTYNLTCHAGAPILKKYLHALSTNR